MFRLGTQTLSPINQLPLCIPHPPPPRARQPCILFIALASSPITAPIFCASVKLNVAPIPGGAGKTVGQRVVPLISRHAAARPWRASVFHEYGLIPRDWMPPPPTVAPSPVILHLSSIFIRFTMSLARDAVESSGLQNGKDTAGPPGKQPCANGKAGGGVGAGGGSGGAGAPSHIVRRAGRLASALHGNTLHVQSSILLQ